MGFAYCEIPLGRGGHVAIVDTEDYERLVQFKWYALRRDKTVYATRHVWRDGKRTTQGMHRLVLSAEGDAWVDHINHNGLDNRRSNLRLATRAQNKVNSAGTYCNKWSCAYIGVYPSGSGWGAQVGYGGRKVFVGYFNTLEEAALARDRKAVELHGGFATLNFPERNWAK